MIWQQRGFRKKVLVWIGLIGLVFLPAAFAEKIPINRYTVDGSRIELFDTDSESIIETIVPPSRFISRRSGTPFVVGQDCDVLVASRFFDEVGFVYQGTTGIPWARNILDSLGVTARLLAVDPDRTVWVLDGLEVSRLDGTGRVVSRRTLPTPELSPTITYDERLSLFDMTVESTTSLWATVLGQLEGPQGSLLVKELVHFSGQNLEHQQLVLPFEPRGPGSSLRGPLVVKGDRLYVVGLEENASVWSIDEYSLDGDFIRSFLTGSTYFPSALHRGAGDTLMVEFFSHPHGGGPASPSIQRGGIGVLLVDIPTGAVLAETLSEEGNLILGAGPSMRCEPEDRVARLHDGRFEVRVEWVDFSGARGSGHFLPSLSDESVDVWFFDQDNIEGTIQPSPRS